MTLEQNPFPYAGHWYWRDENGKVSRGFRSQREALRNLLDSLDARETWWAWFRLKWTELWHDTRGQGQGVGQSGPKG